MDRILRFLSSYSADLTYEKLPQEVVHQVKRRIIDALGCAMGGYPAKPCEAARAHAMEVTGNPGATVLGTSHRTAPEIAAFTNGVMVRYLDFNDTGMGKESGHPSDNISAVLAAAEYIGASGPAAITGIVLAYEIQGRLGETSSLRERGWDHVAYLAISSAAGSGKVMSLTHEQMANALALSVTANIPLRQTRVGSLSMWKGCAAGNACRNGLFAALMARRGLTGPEEAFEGRYGLLNQVTGPIELPSFGGSGKIFKVEDAKFKYFPADYEAQCAVHPAIEIHQVLMGRVEEIEKVIVNTYDLAVEVAADTLDKWEPNNRETADHSIPYILAVALTKGDVWLDDFIEERFRDPKLLALMKKIEIYKKEEYTRAYPEAYCHHIEVITRSGEHHVRETRYAKGHPKNPLTDQEIEEKFRRLSEPIMKPARISRILDQLWHLEEVRDLRKMMVLFQL